MRELRLKYIINMVSDIASRAKTDERALTIAQKAVKQALSETNTEIGLMERLLLRVGGVAGRSAEQQAQYIARLAMRYQDLRKAAEGAAKAMQTAAAVGSGAAAGAYAVDRMTRAPMEYSLRLAHMANTAYADRDVAGRVAGKGTLNAAITAAIRTGGGSRDDAAGALDMLIASGAVDINSAIKLLPMLMRGSTASGATAEQLGGIALRGMQSFGLRLDQVPEALNMAMAAGQAGGFELKDMAKWLPQSMAAGRLSGLSGMEGLRRILAGMQAGVIVSGTKDEAGNNMVNLLAKIASQDTANDLKKLGIDLHGTLARDRARGMNSLDSFVGIVDGVAQQDADYRAMKKKLAGTQDDSERKATLQAMTDILQGRAIGKVIQDRQALMQLVASMNNRDLEQRVMQFSRTNANPIGTSFDVVSREVSFSRQRALNEAAIGSETAFDKVGPALGAVAGTAADVAAKFPNLTAGVIGATGAVVAFTAALGASGLIGILTGRAGNAGGVIGQAAAIGAGAVASAATAPFKMTNGGAWARQLGGTFLPLVGAGLEAWQVSQDAALSADGRRQGYAGAAVGALGGWGGAYGGAALGTALFPGVGTLVGGAAGGLAGYLGAKGALNWLWSRDPGRDLSGPDGKPLSGPGTLGQGKLDVNVSVRDDRVQVGLVPQSSSALQINAGPTDPGSFLSGTSR